MASHDNKKIKDGFIAKMDSFFYKLKPRFIYTFTTGIENIIRWMPIVWKDRDFDEGYIYEALHFKLKNTYDFLTSDDTIAIHHKNHLTKLKICVNLAERVREDFYIDRASSQIRPYDTDINFLDSDRWIKLPDGGRQLTPMGEDEKKSFLKFNRHCYYLEQQDLDMLHGIMAKYSKYWWD